MRIVRDFVRLCACVFALSSTMATYAVTLEWLRQPVFDPLTYQAWGVSADGSGNVYLAGKSGLPYVAKYDGSGTLLWSHQFSNEIMHSVAVAADSAGNVYVTGETNQNAAFLSKIDADGNRLWTWESGIRFNLTDRVSVDGNGNVYISGSSGSGSGTDAFFARFNSLGNLQWRREFGTTFADSAKSITTDGLGNVYLAGFTAGDLAGPHIGPPENPDAFLARYDEFGNHVWTRQFGDPGARYSANGVAADGLGSIYVCGNTFVFGDSDGGNAFLRKYDVDGNLIWSEHFGTSLFDAATAVSVDQVGNVYIAGRSLGSLGGNAGGAFLRKYDSDGNHIWTQQLSGFGFGNDVSADGLGNVYLAGHGFIAKFDDRQIPEPSTFVLFTLALAPLGARMRRRSVAMPSGP